MNRNVLRRFSLPQLLVPLLLPLGGCVATSGDYANQAAYPEPQAVYAPAPVVVPYYGAAPVTTVIVTQPPPPIPVYAQPPCPAPGYLWTPGYWNYRPTGGYYWVQGNWARPPQPNVYWTPGYWAQNGSAYAFHQGYWSPQVGYYGGVNYGHGYGGAGYNGGHWERGEFQYDGSVNNVDVNRVRNVYNTHVIDPPPRYANPRPDAPVNGNAYNNPFANPPQHLPRPWPPNGAGGQHQDGHQSYSRPQEVRAEDDRRDGDHRDDRPPTHRPPVQKPWNEPNYGRGPAQWQQTRGVPAQPQRPQPGSNYGPPNPPPNRQADRQADMGRNPLRPTQ